MSTTCIHASAGLEGSWGDVDFSDDEFVCDDNYSSDLDDVFNTPTSRDSITVCTQQVDSVKFAPDIEDLARLLQEDGADAGPVADRRGSDSSLSSHESSGSYCVGGGRGARRRASSIHMMACRWDIGMDDAIELCAAFEAQQGAGCG